MAKWGEGDPRWIVEERPDATNVNNWHWTEKNAGPWSKERLKQLLTNLKISNNSIDCTIKEISKIEGDASANNRKGKLIFFYEWNLKLKWEGRLAGFADVIKGEVEIPNLSEENDVDEIEITITITSSGAEAQTVKEFMHHKGKEEIRKQLEEYIRSLKQEFSKGLILPKKGETVKQDNVSTITSGFNKKVNMDPIIAPTSTANLGCKLDTKSIEISEKFQCRAQEFFDAMTRIEMVTAFTRGHVKMDAEKGGKFSLFGGNITGEFRDLVPGKKIEQYWRYKQWPDNHFSEVTMKIEEKEDHTLVTVKQDLIPSAEVETTQTNWRRYYFDSIKKAFGFGAFL